MRLIGTDASAKWHLKCISIESLDLHGTLRQRRSRCHLFGDVEALDPDLRHSHGSHPRLEELSVDRVLTPDADIA